MYNDINNMYVRCLGFTYNSGTATSPRDQLTREIMNLQATIKMVDPVITIPERKLNYKFMLAEAIWILTGDNRLEPLTCYCKRMAEFSDDGVTLNGAYGIPYREQLMYVVDKLQSSPDTRQAVMTFWERCPSPSKDIPCTTALQFLIRGGMLHLNVFMRSWDLWLGFPYDIFSFSMIATHVSTFLRNVEPGMLTVTAGSAHIYSRDFAKISEVTKSDNGGKLDIYKYGKYTPDSLIMTLESNLNALNV